MSATVTAAGNSTATAGGFLTSAQSFISEATSTLSALATLLDNAALTIAELFVVFMLVTGLLLYFSRLNRRLGRELAEGGIIIAIIAKFIAPWLMSLHI